MLIKRVLFYLPFLLLLLGPACDSSTDPVRLLEETIQSEVANRLLSAQVTVMARCQEAVLTEAGSIADSILFERARMRRDTAARPLRPYRPDDPLLRILHDSIPVAPLFDSLPRDTSSRN